MTTINREVRIDAPPERVWEIIADFGAIHRYNPGVPSSHLTSEETAGPGTSRHCDLGRGVSVEERIVDWNAGSDYTLEIYDGRRTPPFKSAIARFEVRPDGDGAVVAAGIEYSLKYGPIGALMDRLIVRRQLSAGFTDIAAGLKHYVETGEEVDQSTDLETRAVAA